MIAAFHAKAIQAMDTASLGGIYCRNEEKAVRLREEYPCPVYTDLDEFLSNDVLDIVTVATPSGVHLDAIVKAAKAGKHIICEKPLEISPDKIIQAERAALAHGVLLGGIFNRRFNPAVEELKRAIEGEKFGTISLCEVQVKWFRDQAYYDSAAWRGTWALDGGGTLMNQSIHTIDMLIHFMGMPKRLSASVGTLTHENIEVEDTAVAILEFEKGAKGVIQASTSTYSSQGRPAEIQISGDTGAVILTDDHFQLWDFKETLPEDEKIRSELAKQSEGGQGANDPGNIAFYGHQLNFENFVAAVDGKESLKITAREALLSVVVIDAIYQSARSDGKWVDINIPQ
ncbi:MAG: Gfo/Idh/MocA family oxidoreductase [Roseivirga sp.]|nr:Gfo/Idh/MocA family oxidoreductase [Roseivirga sp.]